MTTETNPQNTNAPEVETRKSSTPKCNLNSILPIVALIGVLALLVLHFTGIGKGVINLGAGQQTTEGQQAAEAGIRIAYINSAILMQDYELAIQLRTDFEAERTRLTNELSRRQRSFQNEVERFQREVQSGSISSSSAQAREQELMQQQQELVQLNETYTNRLMQKEVDMNQELLDAINEFLIRFNAERNFDYVLGMAEGGGILYAAEKHNITDEVLAKLNEEYLARETE